VRKGKHLNHTKDRWLPVRNHWRTRFWGVQYAECFFYISLYSPVVRRIRLKACRLQGLERRHLNKNWKIRGDVRMTWRQHSTFHQPRLLGGVKKFARYWGLVARSYSARACVGWTGEKVFLFFFFFWVLGCVLLFYFSPLATPKCCLHCAAAACY
jgi:hypothetical protein